MAKTVPHGNCRPFASRHPRLYIIYDQFLREGFLGGCATREFARHSAYPGNSELFWNQGFIGLNGDLIFFFFFFALCTELSFIVSTIPSFRSSDIVPIISILKDGLEHFQILLQFSSALIRSSMSSSIPSQSGPRVNFPHESPESPSENHGYPSIRTSDLVTMSRTRSPYDTEHPPYKTPPRILHNNNVLPFSEFGTDNHPRDSKGIHLVCATPRRCQCQHFWGAQRNDYVRNWARRIFSGFSKLFSLFTPTLVRDTKLGLEAFAQFAALHTSRWRHFLVINCPCVQPYRKDQSANADSGQPREML